MSQPFEPYITIVVETFEDRKTGKVRVRPIEGEIYPQSMVVECARSVRHEHDIGTKFQISAKLTNREGGGPFLYSHHSWPMKVLKA